MAATTVESNIALVRDYTLRVFNEHNPALAAEFVTPDVKWHGGTLGSIEGSDNLIALLSSFIGALPDLNAQVVVALARRVKSVHFVDWDCSCEALEFEVSDG